MLTYAPYFISTVIVVSLIIQLCDVRSSLFNILRDIMSDAQTQANMVQPPEKCQAPRPCHDRIPEIHDDPLCRHSDAGNLSFCAEIFRERCYDWLSKRLIKEV